MSFGGTTLTPEMQMWLRSQLQNMGGQGQQQSAQQGQLPQAQPGQQQPPSPSTGQPQMPQFRGPAFPLPSGQVQRQLGNVPYSAQPTYQKPGVSGHGVGMFPAAVMAIKQKMHGDKVQKFRGLANEQLAMQQDPDTQAKLQQAASKDPNMQKALDKKQKEFVKMMDDAQKDPNSAAAQGIQLAYRDQQQKDAQQQSFEQTRLAMEEIRARIQAEMQRGQYWQQIGAAAGRKGEVTEEDRFKADQKEQVAREQINARLSMNKDNIAARRKNLTDQIASLEKRTAMQQKGAMARTKERVASDQAIAAMLKQYKNVESRYNTLDREQTALEKEISDKPFGSWMTGEDDVYKAKIGAIDAQRKVLDDQMDQIGDTIDQMTQGKLIPGTASATPEGEKAAPSGQAKRGSKENPIVIK